jgi:predicted nuclease with TOPRIM domain
MITAAQRIAADVLYRKQQEQIKRLEAENARLKEELRPWEMLQEIRSRCDTLKPIYKSDDKWHQVADEYLFLREDVLTMSTWQATKPGWIKAKHNEWRERFPQGEV